MHRVLLLGAGKIGRKIARFLNSAGDYDLLVADIDVVALERMRQRVDVPTEVIDANDEDSLLELLEGRDSVISALTYHANIRVAKAALQAGVSYFDLTEDIATTQGVRAIAQDATPGQIFMPQCGLAPGFVSIAGYHLIRAFETVDTLHMRVGALPQFPSNGMKYNLTWSTYGLINEYCNPCQAIHEGRCTEVMPLEGLEQFSLDGVRYEAFNTSGGLGTLCETLDGRVRELNYKTVRYVGHRDLMMFLIHELRLGERRQLLAEILEDAVPVTFQDVVVVFCTATGWSKGEFVQISDARKIYQQSVDGQQWSAIQITTAAAACAVLDLHVAGKLPNRGFVRQEEVSLPDFLNNRFGRYYQSGSATRFSTSAEELPEVGHGR